MRAAYVDTDVHVTASGSRCRRRFPRCTGRRSRRTTQSPPCAGSKARLRRQRYFGRACPSVPGVSQPTGDEIERGVAALVPFAQEWGLPLNPEDLQAMAVAV